MSLAVKAKRAVRPRRAGLRTFPKKSAQNSRRLTLEELLRHPAFGMWKDKTATVSEELRQWRKPRYGLG